MHAPHGAASHWPDLECHYGTEEWKAWAVHELASGGEWAGNPIHELTHCFAGNSPARRAIESIPGSGEAWPKWTPLYVYAHFEQDERLARDARAHRADYRRALREALAGSRPAFSSLPAYDPCGGFLVELGDALGEASPRDPSLPIARAFRSLNASPEDLLDAHSVLSVARLLAELRRAAGDAPLAVARRWGCGIQDADLDAWERFEARVVPRVLALAAGSEEAEAEVDALVAELEELRGSAPLGPDLAEQGLAALQTRLTELDREPLAAKARKARRWRIEWRFLGPLAADGAASADELLAREGPLERARTFAHALERAPEGSEWRAEPGADRSPVHDLSALLGSSGRGVVHALGRLAVDRRGDTPAIALVSADDRARLRLDGALVDTFGEGSIDPLALRALELDLRPGEHALLVVVAGEPGGCGFSLRLASALPVRR